MRNGEAKKLKSKCLYEQGDTDEAVIEVRLGIMEQSHPFGSKLCSYITSSPKPPIDLDTPASRQKREFKQDIGNRLVSTR